MSEVLETCSVACRTGASADWLPEGGLRLTYCALGTGD